MDTKNAKAIYLCVEETFSVARGLYRDPLDYSWDVGMSQSFTFEEIEVQFSLLAQN